MNYAYMHKTDEKPSQDNFPMHSHDFYELYLFLKGDCEYIVEGISYPLAPNDLIFISNREMHKVQHNSPSFYERIVINISKDFFTEMHCGEYEKLFTEKRIGRNNKIDHRKVDAARLSDAILRLDKYSGECSKNDMLPKCVIVEILHIMNNIDISTEEMTESSLINGIIEYLNRNLTSPLSLREIADKFYISKYHLCRIFKGATGLTVCSYINHKRIITVKGLCASGMTISRACLEAGFGTYSAFYRAYIREYNQKPKDELLR